MCIILVNIITLEQFLKHSYKKILKKSLISYGMEALRKFIQRKSKNDYGARLIEDVCYSEDALLEIMYSKRCKCAIKAGKAGSDYAAREVAEQCGN